MEICNCKQDLERILCDIPEEWREGIIQSLCYVFDTICEQPKCDAIKQCETLTYLSPFEVKDGIASIIYKNERDTTKSSFSILDIIDGSTDGIDPLCLMSQGDWDVLNFGDRIEGIISSLCDCCTTTTSSTTTTTTTLAPTTTTSSTTTTTTIPGSTTTTTTSGIISPFIIINAGGVHANPAILSIVNPTFYTITTGAFPLLQGEEITGHHSGFSGIISFDIQIPGFQGYVRLYRDGIQIACKFCNANGTYSFPSTIYLSTQEIRIVLSQEPGNIGECS